MVKDQALTTNYSNVNNQENGPKDQTNTENSLNATPDAITAMSPSSSFSCSMGVASKLTTVTGSLHMPRKAFHQVSRPENVNSDENLCHSNYDDSDRYNKCNVNEF